ncbi:AMP-binding protein [bacterium]|nr:AMP-binding protein [bacterium]
MIAIYYKDQTISYEELFKKLEAREITDPIFPVSNSLEDLLNILACMVKGIPFFPYSDKLPTKPTIKIPKDADFVLHTSGSSKMKYALFKKRALLDSNIATHPALRLSTGDVYLLNLPLCHVAGLSLVMRALLRGGAIAIEPNDPSIITHLSMVPAQAQALLKEKSYPNLKVLLLGGSKIKKELADNLLKAGYPLYITYGMTEMSSHIAVEKYTEKNGISFSHFLPRRKVLIDRELKVKGCGKFLRYLNRDSQEYHESGDIIEKKDGRFFIKGRKDNMFISGGENIYPEEIELALRAHPSVAGAQVKIVDHFKWGKRPIVSVALKSPLTKEKIRSFLATKLERFKIPKDHEIDLC